MVKKIKVAIFSGNRAEYGLQYPIIKALKNHKRIEYKLLVSGAHLEKNFGNTINEIKKDGFDIFSEIKISMQKDSKKSTALAISSGIQSISKVLEKVNPDYFIVYADRFEGLAAVISSTQMNIPTIHIEGGDITEGGALDDSVRHSMTKLSHFHFTTNEEASKRIINMGEEKWRVKTVGFPAIDMIKLNNYASKEELEKKYKINSKQPILLFTQHSVTTEFNKSKEQIKHSINAIKYLAKKNFRIFVTYPNNDVGGLRIINEINKLKNLKNIDVVKSLGRYNYHGILALAKDKNFKVVCIGNSSSGIKETPVFNCPTINIGSRQNSRLRGTNVIDVDYDKDEIIKSVNKCINNKKFIASCLKTINPYGGGNSGQKIANFIVNIKKSRMTILRKKFIDR